MANTFLDALKARAVAPLESPRPVEAPKPKAEPIEPLAVTVDVVINSWRLDVKFNRNPGDKIRASMLAHGFLYKASAQTWFHKDNEENRAYLGSMFGATFDDGYKIGASELIAAARESDASELMEALLASEPEPQMMRVICSNTLTETPTFSPEFETYKKQVDALLHHTGLSPADLMVYAIDRLYKEEIAN